MPRGGSFHLATKRRPPKAGRILPLPAWHVQIRGCARRRPGREHDRSGSMSLPVINLTAGKGYSFLRRLRTPPGRPIHLGDIKVAPHPIRQRAPDSRHDGTQRQQRDRPPVAGAGHRPRYRAVLRRLGRARTRQHRPSPRRTLSRKTALTPDGLRILDRAHPIENLFVATGHSMLGITLGPASGKSPSRLRAVRQTARTARTLPPRRFYLDALTAHS